GFMRHAWTGRDFTSIGRGDVAKLLDKIEYENGPRQATYCLQVFSSLANWYAARDDNYRSRSWWRMDGRGSFTGICIFILGAGFLDGPGRSRVGLCIRWM